MDDFALVSYVVATVWTSVGFSGIHICSTKFWAIRFSPTKVFKIA